MAVVINQLHVRHCTCITSYDDSVSKSMRLVAEGLGFGGGCYFCLGCAGCLKPQSFLGLVGARVADTYSLLMKLETALSRDHLAYSGPTMSFTCYL